MTRNIIFWTYEYFEKNIDLRIHFKFWFLQKVIIAVVISDTCYTGNHFHVEGSYIFQGSSKKYRMDI